MKQFTLVKSTNTKAEKALGKRRLVLDVKKNMDIRITHAVSTRYLFSIRGISAVSEDGNRLTLTVGNDTYTFVKRAVPFYKVTALTANGEKKFKYLQAATSKEAVKIFLNRYPEEGMSIPTCRELPIPQRFVEEVERELDARLVSKDRSFAVYKAATGYSSPRFSPALNEELVEYITNRMSEKASV